MLKRFFSVLLVTVTLGNGGLILAQDLDSAVKTLNSGQLQLAKEQLQKITQDQPESVPAHIALAECYLKLGDLDNAVASYRRVLKLSPQHTLARTTLTGLLGQKTTTEDALKSADQLMAIDAYTAAQTVLSSAVRKPMSAAVREQFDVRIAACRLWTNGQPDLLLAFQAKDPSVRNQARVIGGLSLARNAPEQARRLLKTPQPAPKPWDARARFGQAIVELQSNADKLQVSKNLAVSATSIPKSNYRSQVVEFAYKQVAAAAQKESGRGNHTRAFQLAWSMVGAGDAPDEKVLLKRVNVQGGWIAPSERTLWLQTTELLGRIAVAAGREAGDSGLAPIWVATEMLRRSREVDPFDAVLKRANDLSTLDERVDADTHKPGDSLGTPDQMRVELIRLLSELADSAKRRMEVVKLINSQLDRYRAVRDVETGLKIFVQQPQGQPADLAEPFRSKVFGAGREALLIGIANYAATAGKQQFDKSASRQTIDANGSLQPFDQLALELVSHVLAKNPGSKPAQQVSSAVLGRYVARKHWAAAEVGLSIVYRGRENAGKWAGLRLQVSRAQEAENELLTARRRLPEKLPARIANALASALERVNASGHKSSRNSAISLGVTLVARYSAIGRDDLATQVIETLGPAPDAKLADWAQWMRAGLLEVKAKRALHVAAAKRLGNAADLPVTEHHVAELKIIDDLITKHADSEYRLLAIRRVLEISNTYESHRSYETAASVLADFVKKHTKLSIREQLEWRIVGLGLVKARESFTQRADKKTVPTELSKDYETAIGRLAEYLKAHPAGNYVRQAETELFNIGINYGSAGAWSVVRNVLDRLAAAIPDRKLPQRLTLLRAITYLGELDRQYALTFLRPAKTTPLPGTGSLAMTDPTFGNDADRAGFGGGGFGGGGGDMSAMMASGFSKDGKESDDSSPFGGAGRSGGQQAAGAAKAIPKPVAPRSPSKTDAVKLPAILEPAADRITRRRAQSLALVQQAKKQQLQQIAMLEEAIANREGNRQNQPAQKGQKIVAMPSGQVLSEAEIARQNAAADEAFKILMQLISDKDEDAAIVATEARTQMYWLFAFFERQIRPQIAISLIERFLKERPDDSEQVALAYRVISNQLVWASQIEKGEKQDLGWLDARHQRFDAARKSLGAFVTKYSPIAAQKHWVDRARLLVADTYSRESSMALPVSNVRAGGLLLGSADVIIRLSTEEPVHPQAAQFPQRLWNLATQLQSIHQHDQAIYVLSQLPIYYPTHKLGPQSVLKIAQLHAQGLGNPVKAVETYLEYASVQGESETVRSAIYAIAQQLQGGKRFIEAIHVYSVFVDSFPLDKRAPMALQAIGQTHQQNEVWTEATQAYRRILAEYPQAKTLPQVKLAIAECQIHLSEWRNAKRQYEQFAVEHPKDGNVTMARARIATLKKLERYQQLLADEKINRNKDDAQLQIGRLVLGDLSNPLKASVEFRKVVTDFPKSDIADDAQIEVGKALLALNRLDEAREALLAVPKNYPGSPVADDALFLVGQSYELQAQRFGQVTAATARREAFTRNQRGAYRSFNNEVAQEVQRQQVRRDLLKKSGQSKELALDEASAALRQNFLVQGSLINRARGAEIKAESESALDVASRQDQINEAYRDSIRLYLRAAQDYPLGDKTDQSLLRIAQIFETQLKDRSQAMDTYQRIVKLFPGTPVAEDAAWKVASFYDQEGKYAAATAAYREFIRNYPASSRVADAQFALAESLEQLDKWVEAMDAYEVFRQKFSKHAKARLAAEQINWIKTYRK